MDLRLTPKSELDPKACEVCRRSKYRQNLFKSVERYFELLGLIHFNIWDLHGVLTRAGKNYFITFIDDYSGFSYVYLFKNKSKALAKLNFTY